MTGSRARRMLAAYGSMAVLVVSLLAIAGFGAWAVSSGASVRQDICEAVADERDALRRVLARFRNVTLANAVTEARRSETEAFWEGVFAEVPRLDCRASGEPTERSVP